MSGGKFVDPLARYDHGTKTGALGAHGLRDVEPGQRIWEICGGNLDAPWHIPGGSAMGAGRQGNFPAMPRITLRGGFFR